MLHVQNHLAFGPLANGATCAAWLLRGSWVALGHLLGTRQRILVIATDWAQRHSTQAGAVVHSASPLAIPGVAVDAEVLAAIGGTGIGPA